MIAFDVLEKVFSVVGKVTHRIEQVGGQERLTIGTVLGDEQVDQILVDHQQQVGMIHHTPTSTTFVLV